MLHDRGVRLDLQTPGGRVRSGGCRAVSLGPLVHREQHLAGLRAGILADHAILRHEVDQPGTAAIAHAQRPLQQRHAAAALADHHLDGGLVHFVAVLSSRALRRIARRGRLEVHELLGILRLGRADRGHHAADLLVGEIGALATQDLTCAGGEEEHVAVAEQPFRTALIEHDSAIGPAGHLEGDAGWQVALDQARDHVDRRLLRGEDQVDADGPALLGQPDDVLLDLLACRHHHVGDLVGDHHDVRHRRGNRGSLFVGLEIEPLEQLLAAKLVVLREMPHAHLGEHGISLFHLLDGPGEDRLRLLHVGHHRVHEMRQRLVGRQFDHLRVDHQHPHLVGPPCHQHRHDDRVQADALARAGAAGDQKVGQARHVEDHRIASHVLAEVERDLHRPAPRLRLLDHLAEADHLAGGVWHLDAHRVLARDRGHDTDARHPQGDCQVVGEVGDLRQAEASLQFDLILRDDRTGLDLNHAHLEAEVAKRLFEHAGAVADFLLLLVELQLFGRQEQFQ